MKTLPYDLLALLGGILLFFGLSSTVYAYPTNTISKIYIFGDSLSDMGNNKAKGAPITNGETWPYFLANELIQVPSPKNQFKQQILPSNYGGTNYAVAGANAAAIAGQIQNYLQTADQKADPNAVYIIWGGGNDIIPNPKIDTSIVAKTLADTAKQLLQAGATQVYMLNLPDMGIVPNLPIPDHDQYSKASTAFNQYLQKDIAGTAIHYIDVAAFISYIHDKNNHLRYGLTNVTDSYTLIDCRSKNDCNPNHYMFWAGPHPTAVIHMMIATQVCNAMGDCFSPTSNAKAKN